MWWGLGVVVGLVGLAVSVVVVVVVLGVVMAGVVESWFLTEGISIGGSGCGGGSRPGTWREAMTLPAGVWYRLLLTRPSCSLYRQPTQVCSHTPLPKAFSCNFSQSRGSNW